MHACMRACMHAYFLCSSTQHSFHVTTKSVCRHYCLPSEQSPSDENSLEDARASWCSVAPECAVHIPWLCLIWGQENGSDAPVIVYPDSGSSVCSELKEGQLPCLQICGFQESSLLLREDPQVSMFLRMAPFRVNGTAVTQTPTEQPNLDLKKVSISAQTQLIC